MCVPNLGVMCTRIHVQVEVSVNTRPGNKSKTTSSPVFVLQFIDEVKHEMYRARLTGFLNFLLLARLS